METSMWHESSDFAFLRNNVPPVLDIAMDMVAPMQQWSTADMDLLHEVNDDIFVHPKRANELGENSANNVCADTNAASLIQLENNTNSNKCKDDSNIEFSNTGEKSVFISRHALVNSDAGLCVKSMTENAKANTSSNAPTQSEENLENNVYSTADNQFGYDPFTQQPYINYTTNCHYGYQPPNYQYNVPMATYQQCADMNYIYTNNGNPYTCPVFSTQPQFANNIYYTPGAVGSECITGGVYQNGEMPATETNQVISENGRTTEMCNGVKKEALNIIGNDTKLASVEITNKSSSVENGRDATHVTSLWSGQIACKQRQEINMQDPNFYDQHFPPCTSNTQDNAETTETNSNLHPVPFNPKVPPPPLIETLDKEAPKKMLLYDQTKKAPTYKAVAEATTPSGFKFYIPLDQSRYALKESKHDLYDIPERCSFHIFDKEGDFESSVFLDTSPRPIQIKGSLSDNDDTSSESGDSDISQLTAISTKRSNSRESLYSLLTLMNIIPGNDEERHVERDVTLDTKRCETTTVNTIGECKESNVVAKEMEISDAITHQNKTDETETMNLQQESDEVTCDSETVEIKTDTDIHVDVNNYVNNEHIRSENIEQADTEKMSSSVYMNDTDSEINDSVNDVSFEVIVNTQPFPGNSFQIQTDGVYSAAHSSLSADANVFVPQDANAMCLQPGMQFDPQNSAYAQQWIPVQVECVDPEQFVQLQQLYGQTSPGYCQQFPVFANDQQQVPIQFLQQDPIGGAGVENSTVVTTTENIANNQTKPESNDKTQKENSDDEPSEDADEKQTGIPQDLIDPNDGLPYPALHISDDGLLTVILRHGVYVEMTVDKAIRIVNHEKKLVASFNDTGSKVCIIHPAARIYQSETSVDAELSLGRKAKMTSQSIVFGNALKTYKFDYNIINELPEFSSFRCLNEDLSVNFLDTDTGFFNSDVFLRCSELITRAYFEKQGEAGCKVIINGSKISQSDDGDVTVYSGSIRHLRMSPITGVIRIRTQFVEIDIERNWNLKLKRGTHTLNSSHLGFILSNGKIKASLDQKNKMEAFTLPYYRKLPLGQTAAHRRPGGPRRRNVYYNTRYEPENDHWGYARH